MHSNPCESKTVESNLEKQMNWIMIMLCFWSASAALGAFFFLVLKPKLQEFAQTGRKERERIWECMDRVAQRLGSLKLLGLLVTQEQRALEELRGSASLLALERGCPQFRNAGFLLLALAVDSGMMEAEIELIKARHGYFFYHCFLRSTAESAYRMVQAASLCKSALLNSAAIAAVPGVRQQ